MQRNSQKKDVQQSKIIFQPVKTVDGQTIIKKYIKLKEVGAGSYSKCYLVKNINSESTYVVKILPKKKIQILAREKLFYEIKIHQSLSHPNVVHLDHWFEDEDNQYIFMEYCSEGNLQMVLRRKKVLSEKQIKFFAKQIAESIAYIHSQKILHRDLKLCNFYLDENYNVKLGDFGFACQLAHENDRKRETCGTPNYIAPEAISGFGYSFSSDIWALGVILFRLKYKFCPFEGETVKETLEKVKICHYKYPKGVKISHQLKDLITNIFNLNYDERLTIEEILNHPFFDDSTDKEVRKKLIGEFGEKEEKKGFSLSKLFSSKDEGKNNKQKSVLKESSKKSPVKRSNSCETFKQIKQIFKTKSKSNLTTQTNMTLKTEANTYHNMTFQNTTFNTIQSMREKDPRSNRNIIEVSFQNQHIKKEEPTRTNRLNEFIKSQVNSISHKQQVLKTIGRKNPSLAITNGGSKQLGNYSKKYYLPMKIQNEKDVIIIHYKPSIKQIIYQNCAYIIHRNPQQIYNLNGEEVQNVSKLLKYILEHKFEVKEAKDDEEYGQIKMQKIISFIAHSWIQSKEGIILKFGKHGSFMVGKQYQQEAFCIYEEEKVSLMYSQSNNIYKVIEGVALMRIYNGWVKSLIKK